jgi:hypothetical protein
MRRYTPERVNSCVTPGCYGRKRWLTVRADDEGVLGELRIADNDVEAAASHLSRELRRP